MTDTSSKTLLAWYDRHKRGLPWRALPNETCDPYHVWLSEIMLQQTTVATVKPYFEKFKTQFPTVHALATAADDDVMSAWAGLGYYSRARNLLKCARIIVAEYDGTFPDTEADLLKLPGIGPYTAAAIAAIAFNRPAAPVDGNIARVLARVYALTTPLPALKAEVKPLNQQLVPADRPGDFAQAMMDLGAMICTPKRPNCLLCPWQKNCRAHIEGIAESLPRRAPKKPKPERAGTVYWLENAQKQVLMVRRANKGLLGGMLTFPSTGWDAHNDTQLATLLPDGWTEVRGEGSGKTSEKLNGKIVHVFTHFRLTLNVQAQTAPKGFRKPAHNKGAHYEWVAPSDFPTRALPSLMRKVVAAVLG